MNLFISPKKNFLLISLVLITFSAFSQFTIGPKVGYSSSKLSLNYSNISSDLKNNFQFGVFMRIGKKIYIQPEVNWLTQGNIIKSSINSTDPPFNQEVKLKMIQIPLLIGAKVINFKKVNFRVFSGPIASIVSSKTIENKVAGYIAPLKDTDLKDLIWSVQVGAGIDIFQFTFDIRYNFGINNVIKTTNISGIGDNVEFKTNGFNVILGLKLF
jgi:hypothetical protein